jgi:hypothetical protein
MLVRNSLRPLRDFLGVLCGKKLLTAKERKGLRKVRKGDRGENRDPSIR